MNKLFYGSDRTLITYVYDRSGIKAVPGEVGSLFDDLVLIKFPIESVFLTLSKMDNVVVLYDGPLRTHKGWDFVKVPEPTDDNLISIVSSNLSGFDDSVRTVKAAVKLAGGDPYLLENLALVSLLSGEPVDKPEPSVYSVIGLVMDRRPEAIEALFAQENIFGFLALLRASILDLMAFLQVYYTGRLASLEAYCRYGTVPEYRKVDLGNDSVYGRINRSWKYEKFKRHAFKWNMSEVTQFLEASIALEEKWKSGEYPVTHGSLSSLIYPFLRRTK